MIPTLDHYRELVEAAERAGHPFEVGAAAEDPPLVVMIAPYRFAFVIASRPGRRWIVRRPGETLPDYATRAHAALDPLTARWVDRGLLPIAVAEDEAARADAAEQLMARLGELRSVLLAIAQGVLAGDEGHTEAEALVGAPAASP